MKNFKPLWEMPPDRRKGEWAARGVGVCPICKGGIEVGQMISPWLGRWAHSDCKPV